eukprot:CAMPEP_0194326910 /NCGR_PEP_ID=MMETSP0171-20130528/38799_1 /TAXON_ID=218684 /ORGANISM="Corethron pennatum, Strain L29A3" /LENGTH=312 /DNA_ID=CAMNT_0039086663 /DNA_START=143 /DNA_END=1081 /DNA_ORIENTATION=-
MMESIEIAIEPPRQRMKKPRKKPRKTRKAKKKQGQVLDEAFEVEMVSVMRSSMSPAAPIIRPDNEKEPQQSKKKDAYGEAPDLRKIKSETDDGKMPSDAVTSPKGVAFFPDDEETDWPVRPPGLADALGWRRKRRTLVVLIAAAVVGSILGVLLSPRKPTAATVSSFPLRVVGSTSSVPLGRCEGNCGADEDCGTDLACFPRKNEEDVPGCSGDPRPDIRYCVHIQDHHSDAMPFAPPSAPPTPTSPQPAPVLTTAPTTTKPMTTLSTESAFSPANGPTPSPPAQSTPLLTTEPASSTSTEPTFVPTFWPTF